MQPLAPHLLTRLLDLLPARVRSIGRLGFGHQGGLATALRMFPLRALTPTRRAVSLLAGSLIIGTGVAMLSQARLGLAPYDVLVSGLQPRVGLSFGQTVWAVSGLFFLMAIVLGQRPSRWGVAYVLATGVAIDAVAGLIGRPEALVARVGFVTIALLALAAGISLVVHSGSTGGAFELLMRAGEERGYDRRVVRTSLEVGVLVLGVVLGGSLGPATFAIALGIGPLLGVVGQALEDHAVGRSMRQIDTAPRQRHPSAMAARVR